MTIRNHTTWLSFLVPQGQHFINRRLQPTGVMDPTLQSPAWDDTLLFCKIAPISSAVPCGTMRLSSFSHRKLKHTVNKVLSLRDTDSRTVLSLRDKERKPSGMIADNHIKRLAR